MALLLGLDVGTTSTIGILIDDAGRTLGVASRPVTLYAQYANWAEEDTEEWWRNAGEIVRELVTRSGVSADKISGAGVTGMLPVVILVDENGMSLRRSIQQNDARAITELETLHRRMDENDFVSLTGTGYSQQLIGPKLAWLRAREPEVFQKVRYVMGASDYITSRLTSTFQVEHNWALESGLVNLSTGRYDERLLESSQVDPRILPPIRKSHEIVGSITPRSAAHLGISPGIPVVAGCADHVASAFVCGAANNGDLVIKFGGAADILLSSDKAVADRRLYLDHHIVPGLFFSNGCMAAGGNLLNWIADHWAGGEVSSAASAGLTLHQWLDRMATPVETELLFLPYILGEKTPLMDPYARGTMIGFGLHQTLGDVWRAALEGIVFGMRHHVETFAENRLTVSRVLATDGGAASDLWLQIAADGLELPVTRVDRHPGSCLGAAFIAAIATGAIHDWGRIGSYVTEGRTFRPNT
ncbi:MAG: FGGY-family carbohydrate kinase, partial [Aestuariivirgaceae bacterium]